jgi:glutamate dehydrogenase
MTVNPGTGAGVDGSADSPPLSQDTIARLARAYMATYRGPHGDAPGADSAVTGPVDRTAARMMSPALVDAHCRLGRHRSIGDTRVAVYADDDPGGLGPALQIVTDNAPMLMDSVSAAAPVRASKASAIRCSGRGATQRRIAGGGAVSDAPSAMH